MIRIEQKRIFIIYIFIESPLKGVFMKRLEQARTRAADRFIAGGAFLERCQMNNAS